MATHFAFDASGWMTRFQAVGGAYALTGEHLHLWPAPGNRTGSSGRAEAYAMVAGLSTDDRQHLLDHLLSTAMVED